jgi:hypothetical protein
LLLAVRFDHVFEHLDASVSQSKPLNVQTVTVLSLAQVQVPQLIQGCLGSEFQQDGRVWAPGCGSSAAARHHERRTYEFARLASYIGARDKRCKPGN